jgi:hypothetical protein
MQSKGRGKEDLFLSGRMKKRGVHLSVRRYFFFSSLMR